MSRELRHINLHYPMQLYAGLPEWRRYAAWLRRHMAVSLGLAPAPARGALRTRMFGRWQGDGYTCEKVFFESLPGFFVTGNLFRPAAASRRQPVILCPHGHWPDGRLHDRDPRGSVIARCIQLARMGACVFSHDMPGYNDACQVGHRDELWDLHYGMSNMALQTWNCLRALDFLLSLPDVDARRVGITGTSGGGTQTFVTAALDERVTAAAPICMVSYQMQGGCICENAPLLRLAATSVEIARLTAPRPMFLGSCPRDWTRDTAQEELPAIRNIYDLYGAGGRIMHRHVDDEHNYNQEMREHVYGFFNRFLFGGKSSGPVPEVYCQRPPHRDRLVWWGREPPPPVSFAGLRCLWRARAEAALRPGLRSAASARRLLGPLLPHALGLAPDAIAVRAVGHPRRIVCEQRGRVLTLRPVEPPPDPRLKDTMFYEAYNPTAFAERVHEILAAVARGPARVELVGCGAAGPAALAAMAVSRRVAAGDMDLCGFDPARDRHWTRFMHTPSIRQVGGLATIFAMVGSRPLKLRRVTANATALQKKYAR